MIPPRPRKKSNTVWLVLIVALCVAVAFSWSYFTSVPDTNGDGQVICHGIRFRECG